jgi:ribonuclease D
MGTKMPPARPGKKKGRRGPPSYRTRKRAQSHLDAMGEDGDHQEIPDDPLIPAGEPELITSSEGLAAFLEHARESGRFAYDTEFIGELTYFPKLCVIQMATTERLGLVDPIEGPDLRPLWEAIADPAVETIVHAGTQDLEPVVRLIDRAPANIFDTQIAAGFTGLPYPLGLRKLVQEMAGVKLAKGFTFTQWDHRPLSPRHLRYAADDVRYLMKVREGIGQRLATRGHEDWALDECGLLGNADLYRFDPATQFLRVKSADTLDGKQLAILRELVAVRDAAARHDDVPARSLLKDDMLVRIAKSPPATVPDLAALRGFARPVARDHGDELLAAIARGREQPPVKRPAIPREEEATERVRIESLLSIAGCWCLAHGVDPSLAMTRADVAAFYRRHRKGKDLDDLRITKGWRAELLGGPLQAMLDGRSSLSICWRDGGLSADE